jgi:hypothetical protein
MPAVLQVLKLSRIEVNPWFLTITTSLDTVPSRTTGDPSHQNQLVELSMTGPAPEHRFLIRDQTTLASETAVVD